MISVEINGVKINSFCIEDVFKNLFINTFKNLCSPYGITFDHRLRDIVDFYSFCVGYKDLITADYINSLDEDYIYKISLIMDLLKEFYPKEKLFKLSSALTNLRKVQYNIDAMVWDIDIYERFFNRQLRIDSHEQYRYSNYTNKGLDEKNPIYMYNFVTPPPKYYQIPILDSYNILYKRNIDYKICVDKELVLFEVKIPKELKSLKFSFNFATTTKKRKDNIYFCYSNHKLFNLSTLCRWEITVLNNFDIIKVHIPNENFKFVIDGKINMFLFLEIDLYVNEKKYLPIAYIGNSFSFQRFILKQ